MFVKIVVNSIEKEIIMKKQTALLLSSLVLMSAVAMQPANAFSLFHKKVKPVVAAPAKTEAVKPTAPAKAAVKPACNCTKAAAPAAAVKPVAKVTPAAPAKAPVKPVASKAPVKK